MSIEAEMLVDMVLETHPTSPRVDSTALKSQPVRPSAPDPDNGDSCVQEDQQGVSYILCSFMGVIKDKYKGVVMLVWARGIIVVLDCYFFMYGGG